MLGRGASLLLLLPVTLPAQAVVPMPVRKSLEAVAQDLTKNGWPAEATAVVSVLQDLGHEPAALASLRAALAKLQPKNKAPTAGDRIALSVKKAAAALAATLATNDDHREVIARAVVRLDDQAADAQKALARSEYSGTWLTEANIARAKRGAEIRTAIANARRLQLDVKVEAGTQPLFQELLHVPSVRASCGPLTVESEWPAEKVARVVRTTLQALALSNYLIDGSLVVPTDRRVQLRSRHMGSKVHYDQAVRWYAGKNEMVTHGDPTKLAGVFVTGEVLVCHEATEAGAEAALLYYLIGSGSFGPACLFAGHIDWLTRAYFGEPRPSLASEEAEEKRAAGTETSAEVQERTWRQHLAAAGLLGGRSWLTWLAERGQDPPYSRCFVDVDTKLIGDELLKATFACELLYESGAFGKLWRSSTADFARELQQALGVTVEGFDPAFREWLVPPARGVAQSLTSNRTMPADVAAALAKLVEIRHQATASQFWPFEALPDPHFDEALAASTRRHAAYLRANPEQTKEWPGAHEEYPDRQGYSPEGAWAGSHSVIAPGVKSLSEAIDAWMGTFYHRVPLLALGLRQCGMSIVDGIAVMDVASMVTPTDGVVAIGNWPPAGAKNVPLRFTPELPNPLPGVDQSKLGFPITLQYSEASLKGAVITMSLHEGGATGPTVDCHFATPTAPTNPDLAPSSVWCLMPKSALSPNKTYTVVFKLGSRDEEQWSFQTGAK